MRKLPDRELRILMKQLLKLLCFSLLCGSLWGQSVFGGSNNIGGSGLIGAATSSHVWAFKQAANSNNTGGCGTVGTGLCTTTFGSANTSGSLMVACFWINWTSSEQTISSVTDPTNGAWTVVAGSLVSDTTNDFFIQCAYVHNTASTALTISLTLSSFTFNYTGVLYEASDGNTTNPLDKSAVATEASALSWTTAGVTTTVNNELLIGFGVQDSGAAQSWTAGTSYTNRCALLTTCSSGSANHGFIIEDQVQATAASGTTASATYGTTAALMGNLMTFQP
jgi:hypothetical protein